MQTFSQKTHTSKSNNIFIGQPVIDITNWSKGTITKIASICEAEFKAGNKVWKEEIPITNITVHESQILHAAKPIVLSENEIKQVEDLSEKICELLKAREITLEKLDEGLFSKIIGGVAGFIVGPSIARAICKALGIGPGILYDALTSRLAGAALGKAIADNIGGNVEVKDSD